MSAGVGAPGVFPVGGRRLVVYVVYDRRGVVDDFIPFALAGLREHAERILVVVNGELSDVGRSKLVAVSDDVLVRDNVGFDIGAHKDALAYVGDGLMEFDEVVLTNDTWFGPIRPYGPVFDEMARRPAHFWGMTDHAEEVPNPFTGTGVLPYHLQSFWIAVRREMFSSQAWESYWRDLPPLDDYFDAVLKHEILFTEHFAEAGYTHDVAFAERNYPTDHPALFNADLILADGCPLLKRRPFFHYPPFLDRHAVIGRRTMQQVASYGFPVELIWQNLARTISPKILNADAGMLEVLPDVDVSYDPDRPLRIVVILYVDRPEAVREAVECCAGLPGRFDLVVTSPADPDAVRAELDNALPEAIARWEVRSTPTAGHDMSAFFAGCRDLLCGDDYDLVVKVHTRLPQQQSINQRRYFHRHQWDNLLGSPGFVRNVLALFQQEAGLGVVFPPTIHVGTPTLGGAWFGHRFDAERLCRDLGIHVPLDGASPLAPLGGMWVARPAAMALLSQFDWRYEDYEQRGGRSVPHLEEVQQRLVVYAAAELGFHTRTVLNAEHAGLSHNSLEYKLDQLASTTPGYAIDQIQFLHSAGQVGSGRLFDFARMYMRRNQPGMLRTLYPVYRPLRGLVHRMRHLSESVRRRLRMPSGNS